jgi:hypothetical protein
MEQLPGFNGRGTIALKEQPCLNLQNIPFQKGIESAGIKPKKAHVICHCLKPEDCSKTKNKMEITMACFRIMRHDPKRKEKEAAPP